MKGKWNAKQTELSHQYWARQLAPTLSAVQTYWPVLLTLLGCALAVLLAYYWFEPAAGFFDAVATWKNNGGLLLVAMTTVFSGGVLPELVKRFARPTGVKPPPVGELLHQFAMWAILGLWVNLLYWLQSQLFGDAASVPTVVGKVVFDQLICTPLVSLPFIVSWFMLYEARYRMRRWLRSLTFSTLAKRIVPLWLTSLSFWPVMLLVIYSLPLALQFPLFLFVNAAFSVLMIFIVRRQGQAVDEAPHSF